MSANTEALRVDADSQAPRGIGGAVVVSFQLYVELTGRLLLALVLCGLVGVQRALSGKAAGVRTHIMVGLGAALMTIVSAYAFPGWPTDASRDPTRIAAQIVSGIGFIGGGMILKTGLTVRGLTTAASIWAVAGVGMAVGSGLAPLAIVTTGILLITLSVLGRLENKLPERHRTHWTLSFSLPDPAHLHDIHMELKTRCSGIHLIGFDTVPGGTGAIVTFELSSATRFDVVQASSTITAQGAEGLRWKADSYGEDLT
jgi:putative Mg2+ transporter-C (MgtC) family protein